MPKNRMSPKICSTLLFVIVILLSLCTDAGATEIGGSQLMPPLAVLWEYQFDGEVKALEASNDTLFVGADQIYAFDADTGALLWRYNASGEKLCYYLNTIYVGGKAILALHSSTGTLNWSYDYRGTLEDLFVEKGTLYVKTSEPAFLYALNPLTGYEQWVYDTKTNGSYAAQIYNGFACLSASRLAFIEWGWEANRIPFARVLNTATGEKVWESTDETIIWYDNVSVVNEDTIVIIASQNETKSVLSINTCNFTINWRREIPELCALLMPELCPDILPCWDMNSVYIPFSNKLEAVDVKTGELNWAYEIDTIKAIYANNGNIYVCAADKLSSLNSSTGRLNWVFKITDHSRIFNTTAFRVEDKNCAADSVHFFDDALYLFSDNNHLYSSTYSGNCNWDVQLNPLYSVFPAHLEAHNDVLYVVKGGTLYLIDTNRGLVTHEFDIVSEQPYFTRNVSVILGLVTHRFDTVREQPYFTKNASVIHTSKDTIVILSSESNAAVCVVESARSAILAVSGKTDVTDAQNLLGRAEEALYTGDFASALRYANEAKESAIMPHITAAETAVKWCNYVFADASEAEKQLENAKRAYVNRAYQNTIREAIGAKKTADESVKMRLYLLTIIFLCVSIALIFLKSFGSRKINSIMRYIEWLPLLIIIFFVIADFMVDFNIEIDMHLPNILSSSAVTTECFILQVFTVYLLHLIKPSYISTLLLLGFGLGIAFAIAWSGHILSFFGAFIHFNQPRGLFFDALLLDTASSYSYTVFTLIIHSFILIDLILLIILFCLLILYRSHLGYTIKISEHIAHGEYKEAIVLLKKGLNLLEKKDGFITKIEQKDPEYKDRLRGYHASLSVCYYMVGDVEKLIDELKKIKDLSKECIDSIYKGDINIKELIGEAALIPDNFRIFKRNFFPRYLKLKGYIKKPENIKKITFEYALAIFLSGVWGIYIYILLSSNYSNILIIQNPYPPIGLLLKWLFLCSSLVIALIYLLVIVSKVEQGYSRNIFDIFTKEVKTSEKLSRIVPELISLFRSLCSSLFVIIISFVILSTAWFLLDMPFISVELGSIFPIINLGIPILLFILVLLILSFFSEFNMAIIKSIENNYLKSFLYASLGFIGLFLLLLCLGCFVSLFTLLSTSIEESPGFWLVYNPEAYNFGHAFPLLIVSVGVFSTILVFQYKSLKNGMNKRLADAYYSEKKYASACDAYKKLEKYVNTPLHKFLPLSFFFLSNHYAAYGESEFRLGKNEEALAHLNKSLKFAEEGNLTSTLWQTHYKLGQLKESEENLEEAYEHYRKAIVTIEDLRGLVKLPERREAFFENKAEVYAKMVFLCFRLGKDEEAFNYAERAKGRVFLELLGTEKVTVKASAELKEQEEAVLSKIRAIEAKLRGGRGGGERHRRELDALMVEYDALLLKIKEDDPEYYSLRKVDPLTIPEVQRFLTGNEVLVEFFVAERPVVFLIQKDQFAVIELPIQREKLREKTRALSERIRLIVSVKSISMELYNDLLKPLESILNEKDLIIVPHGILHYVPFNALHDGAKWFIERYNARFLQNASLLQFLRGGGCKERSETAFVVGNPTNDLEYAELEARKVAEKFRVKPLLREEARKEAVIAGSRGKDVIHFACHGMFEAGFPRFSRILLADDNLLVSEVYNLELDADLVTLSACQTGLGGLTNGDEVEGLTRAFMRAGTPSVIASLWNVDDESTSELFLRYYDGEGNKVERLRLAQIETMEEYVHPFYWAGFVLFGKG